MSAHCRSAEETRRSLENLRAASPSIFSWPILVASTMRALLAQILSTVPKALLKEDRPGVEEAGEVVRERATGRVRGRGRGRGSRTGMESLGDDDFHRVEELQARRVADEQARIRGLSLQQAHQLLERCMTRDPSLMFDLLELASADEPPPGPPVIGQLTWCVYQNCREMPTDVERKCCGQHHDTCISRLPHMDSYILQEGVLRLARRIWNDVRAEADLPEPGESNRQFRHAAYRQFVVWQYGTLGHGHRVVIPSCCVWRIRDCYPDPHGQYKGFIPCRV